MKLTPKNKKILVFGGVGVGAALIILIGLLFTMGGTTSDGTGNGANPFGSNGDDTRPITGGNNGTTPGGDRGTGTTTPTNSDAPETATLLQVSTIPVIGFASFGSAGVPFVRFMEAQTGHVYETGLTSVSPQKIANVTIPRIAEATWRKDSMVLQYMGEDNNTVRSFFATLAQNPTPESLLKTLNGFFLDDQSIGATLSPDGERAFTLTRNSNGAIGTVVDRKSHATKEIFQSPLTEWIAEWPGGNTVTLNTKSNQDAVGILFFLDTMTGSLTRVLGGYQGLQTRTSPDLSRILFTSKDLTSNAITTSVLNRQQNTTVPISVQVLPETCAWSRAQANIVFCFAPREIPTVKDIMLWYQGKRSFSDNLWKIDADTGNATLLNIPLITNRTELDAIDPELTADESYLLFRNKTDSMLYAYRLITPQAYVSDPEPIAPVLEESATSTSL